jgi:hypothetical protein
LRVDGRAPVARVQPKLITSAMITAQADPIPIATTAAMIQRSSRSGSPRFGTPLLGRVGVDGRNGASVAVRRPPPPSEPIGSCFGPHPFSDAPPTLRRPA